MSCCLATASTVIGSDGPPPATPTHPPALFPAHSPDQISEYIREVFQDRDGVYWFGTNGDGVCRYDGTSLSYLSIDQGFGGVAVRGIAQDSNGALWFATNGGVSRLADGEFTNFTMEHGLRDNSTWSLMVDRNDGVWVGTHAGVCRLEGERFVPFPLPRIEVENPLSRFSPRVVFAMFEDMHGNLWFGTDGEGAHCFDGKTFKSYTKADGLAGNLVRAIRGDRHGRIWIGTDGAGVSCLEGLLLTTYTRRDGLTNDRIFEIYEHSDGTLWFSTLGAGVCTYDGTTFAPFREDETLLINGRPARAHVQEFFEDRDGVLWLGCSGGLFFYDGKAFVNVTRDGPWPKRTESQDRTASEKDAR